MKTRLPAIPLLGLAFALGAAGCTTPKLAQQKRIVYGERHDHELAYEFMQPRKTNGLGVVVMVSGSWQSDPDDFKPMMGRAFLRRGYSLFAVSHLSQPEATIPEIYDDVTRAVQHMCCTARVTSSYCLLYTSPSPRDLSTSRMPSSA